MKQLLLSLIFALVALTGLQAQTIWNGTADTSWYNETSTKFEISTAEQLAGLADLVNNGNDFSYKTVRLTADIVLNDTSDWENWESSSPNNTWTPIGIWDSFSGTFDGQGHTVSGIYINSENYYQGLFGYNEGTIKNVGITESYIKGDYVGGVCGENYNGTITNCYNSGTINGTSVVNAYIGGVCGSNNGTISNCYNSGIVCGTGEYTSIGGVSGGNHSGKIANCYNIGNVSGDSDVGGVCGSNNGTISNCYNSGTVSGDIYVGGVCGQSNSGTISNCYNAGTVNGSSRVGVGGVCGHNYDGTISNCYNSGTVSGNRMVGGVCGHNWGGTISNCYNSGEVSGNSSIGGVCGENNGTISNCYNSGIVNGNNNVGGVCGYNNYDGSISNCYNSGNVSGNYYVGGVCGYNNYDGSISNCYYLEGTATGGINGSDVSGQAAVKTAEQFASGEVCWLLNGSSDANPVWFQTLDTDDYPIWDDTRGTVYAIGNCPNSATYDNAGPSHVGEHADNDHDFRCDYCGMVMLQEPELIEGVYQISNWVELYWFAGLVNGALNEVEQNTAANAVLTADIIINENVLDANGNLTESTDDLLVWTPIGLNRGTSFYGTFDGQGHSVNGIYINSEDDYQGLFGYNMGTIKNIGVTESYIKGDSYIGGVCGENRGTISNCYNSGTVSGGYYVGGVCGSNYEGTISDCYNSGTVSGNGYYVGGVCGSNYEGTISDCYNSGNVNGNRYVGGVCGNNSESSTISNCYNSGTVSGNDYVGGVCSYNSYGIISNCYNSGTVSGNDSVGGVCGDNDSYGPISNCYYLEDSATGGINSSDKSGRAEAKTAKQFASGEVCWLLNEEQSEGAWGQKLGTDPCPVLGGPAVFKNGETYYNEEGSAIVETNSEQASFVIVSENLTINIYGSDGEATVYNLAGNIVYQGIERIIPVPNPGMYMVRIGNEIQKTVVR